MYCSPFRKDFIGVNSKIKTRRGIRKRVYFNNGASPYIAKPILGKLNHFFPCYTYLHEMNYNSDRITKDYEKVRNKIAKFVGVNRTNNEIIFTRTATEGLNLIAWLYGQLEPDGIVLTTCIEHMANYLPYMNNCNVKVIPILPDGTLDLATYESMLVENQGKIKLVTVTGASNVTGYMPPFYKMAELAHKYNAKIVVDCVQLILHQPFAMLPDQHPSHIDFAVFTAHKCYTSLGGAALIGPKVFFEQSSKLPLYGAGSTSFISESLQIQAGSPNKFEVGYPDIAGILCFGRAIDYLTKCDMNCIAEYEKQLRRKLVSGLKHNPNVVIYGPTKLEKMIPFVSFGIKGMDNGVVAKRLGYEYGIVVSYGVSGADIYVQKLQGISDQEAYEIYASGGNYNILRISLGIFNTVEEIEWFLEALDEICSCAGKGLS